MNRNLKDTRCSSWIRESSQAILEDIKLTLFKKEDFLMYLSIGKHSKKYILKKLRQCVTFENLVDSVFERIKSKFPPVV